MYSNSAVKHYVNDMSLRLTPHQKKLIHRTSETPGSMMLGGRDVGQLFQLLLKMLNAKYVIEVGTFTGYTTLTMAYSLPNDGIIVACDVTDKYAAQDIWREAKMDHKIRLEIGPAVNTLKELLEKGHAEKFDFAFIDADKENYVNYYELCLRLVRKGGIIAVDNVLWGGAVADSRYQDDDTVEIRKLNELIRNDNRVDISMLNISDGVTICLKR